MNRFNPIALGAFAGAALCAMRLANASPPLAASVDALQLAGAQRAFALDLFRALPEDGENVFLSPYSISTALGMTYAGARGACAEEMARALRFELPPERLHAAFGELIRADQSATSDGVELAVANALWGQKDYGFLPEYLELTQRHYGGGLSTVDFVGATEPARQTINTWVASHTRDKITELLKAGDVNADTRLVLTNAVYFKGAWATEFDAGMTDEAAFQVSPTQSVEVETMTQRGTFRMARSDGVQVIRLPYRGEKVSMLVILPDKPDGLADVVAKITPSRVEGWFTAAQAEEIVLYMPKFRFRSRFDLANVLGVLGMKAAFGAGADFSGMTGRNDLFISRVVHEAFVEVNEEGTEAAAATGVVMMRTSITPTVRVDHPFLFAIRNEVTGSWLFVGKITNPAA